jgi:hypothetical protein
MRDTNLSFHNARSFYKKIDELLSGPEWTCEMIKVEGDIIGPDGKNMVEHVELWRRNPVECIRELLGNPAFREIISYQPERVYEDAEGTNRIYDEMWTAEWWQEIQVSVAL